MKILEIPLGVLVNFPQVNVATAPQIEFLVLLDGDTYVFDINTNEVSEL
jgi:hypothetical protein